MVRIITDVMGNVLSLSSLSTDASALSTIVKVAVAIGTTSETQDQRSEMFKSWIFNLEKLSVD